MSDDPLRPAERFARENERLRADFREAMRPLDELAGEPAEPPQVVAHWRWPDGERVEIAQWVGWSWNGQHYRGQVAEIHAEGAGVAVVDADDGNRWHFDLGTAEPVRRFPVPLPPKPAPRPRPTLPS